MKNLSIVCFLLLMCSIGCTKNETGLNASTDATTLVENVNALAFDQDVEDLLSDAFTLDASSAKTDASSTKTDTKFRDRYGRCATVSHDEENNIKTIFFDTDCSGLRGQSRTGTVVITYSDENDIIGSFRQTTFDDFYHNGIKIEGVRRSEITDIDTNGNITRLSTLSDGKMIYEDGTFSTKQKSFTSYTVFDETDERESTTLTGSASGVSSTGEDYSLTIDVPVKFLYNCFSSVRFHKRGKIPVEGLKTIVSGSETKIIDYGDGTCDLLAVVTSNGVSETVNLFRLKRGNRFKKF